VTQTSDRSRFLLVASDSTGYFNKFYNEKSPNIKSIFGEIFCQKDLEKKIKKWNLFLVN